VTKRRKRKPSNLSVKSLRVLRGWGVEETLAAGTTVVPVGPAYRLADGRAVRLAFTRDEEGRLCVGYGEKLDSRWDLLDSRPYSARALAYCQRRLRRIGYREEASRGERNGF
jgi:hypothetical protein